MSKRKLASSGQEVAIYDRPIQVKKQKTEHEGTFLVENSRPETTNTNLSGKGANTKDDSSKLARKLAKRERRASKRAQEASQAHEGPSKGKENRGVIALKRKNSNKRRHNEGSKHKRQVDNLDRHGDKPNWKVSDPIGGHMLDLDPIFSQDERFLLLAYHATVSVYSTATSLVVRQLRVLRKDTISGFAFASDNLSHLYISTVSGVIEKWDWVQGSRLCNWKLSSSIYSLNTSSPCTENSSTEDTPGEGSSTDIVYTIDRKNRHPWLLSAHRLGWVEDAGKTDVVTLLKYEQPLSAVKVLEGGRVIVATSESQLILGRCQAPNTANFQNTSYVWRIVDCPEWVASLDVRIGPVLQKQTDKRREFGVAVDVVVGGLKGAIHIYEDLLNQLIRGERLARKSSPKEITSRRLHWHRNSVLATKWSLDGNYIISGGYETTLILWQLETGKTQKLPHLAASIESIVVSPSGSSYSIRLADNSTMIVSTSELKPTFSTAGIQIPSVAKTPRAKLPFIPTVDAPLEGMKPAQASRFPACSSSGHLLLAVPPSITSRQASVTPQNLSYLQTFDTGGGNQISKQALTRTKVTDLNMGPESNTIEEPNVTHIQTSIGGQWLATVDEWMPPKRDFAPLAFDNERLAEEQIFRQEVYLKFWLWNDRSKMWELVSRIDNPHRPLNGDPYAQGRVLGLSSDPSTAAFATIGEDSIVKSWRPAKRRRHGLDVRGKDGSSLVSWHCKHTVPIESIESDIRKNVRGAKLAYSQDGSILAAGLQSSAASPIYLIDTYSGEVLSIQTGLYSGPLLGLGILNKYLITLSHELCVWDLVADERQYGIHLQSHSFSFTNQLSMTHLAVDTQKGLFAIAIPEIGGGPYSTTTLKSQIAIFDPTNPTPLFRTSLPNTLTVLLPAAQRKGFYAIDSAAEVRTILPVYSIASQSMALPKVGPPPTRGLNDIFSNGRSEGKIPRLLTSKFDTVTREPSRVFHQDAPVVSRDKLAEIFDVGPAYAMPPITELFEQVAGLYSGQVK